MKDSLRAEVLQFRKCIFFFSTEALNSIELPPSLEVLAAGDSRRALFALIWQPFWGGQRSKKTRKLFAELRQVGACAVSLAASRVNLCISFLTSLKTDLGIVYGST